jgi:outer membrane lipoprotein-sorting protein
MRPTLALTAAVVALACIIWVAAPHFGGSTHSTEAFAQTMDQIEKAKSITWKVIYYNHITSKDGKRMWVTTEQHECAYKMPGLYRETILDKNGQVKWVRIADTINKRELTLNPKENKGTLSEVAIASNNPRGPFVWVTQELKKTDLQWVEKRQTEDGQINVFRRTFRDEPNGKEWSYDFSMDQKTKQLVELRIPGTDIFDPDKDPSRNNSPEKDWSTGKPVGSIDYDIVFDAELDDSLFRLEPPEGYAVETHTRPHVTEKEMIEYLGILADFNDRTFPDQLDPVPFSSDRINKVWDKPEKERTPAEQKLLDTEQHYIMAGLNSMPTGHFIQDSTVENSFRYLGKTVKLGDKEHIVCWYKLQGANTYRVVYGDLSVKDVPPEALPLSVDP